MASKSPSGKILTSMFGGFYRGLKFIKDTIYIASWFKKDKKKYTKRTVRYTYDKEYLEETSKLKQKATDYMVISNEVTCLGVMRISGTTYLNDKTVLGKLNLGDYLTLKRENNPYDKNAILVLNVDHQKVGYIPKENNILLARLMDKGETLFAQIARFNILGDFVEIMIAVYIQEGN